MAETNRDADRAARKIGLRQVTDLVSPAGHWYGIDDDRDGIDDGLADGYQTTLTLSGYQRPTWRILNEDEIRLLFEDGRRHEIVCGYCDAPYEPRSAATAVRWFHAHDCGPQEAAEAAGIVYSLGAQREGSPFSDARTRAA